jgi:hypothetical protein
VSEFKKVYVINNLIEAQIISSILTERKIPYEIKSYHDLAYDGLFQLSLGYGALYAPDEYIKEILLVIEDIKKGYQETDNQKGDE